MMMMMTVTSPEEGPSRGWLSRSRWSPISPSRPDDNHHEEEEVDEDNQYDDKDNGDDDDDPT